MKRLLDCPLAVTSSGVVLANASHVTGTMNPKDAFDTALKSGRRILIAVVLTPEEVEGCSLKLDDAAAEIVARVYRERG